MTPEHIFNLRVTTMYSEYIITYYVRLLEYYVNRTLYCIQFHVTCNILITYVRKHFYSTQCFK